MRQLSLSMRRVARPMSRPQRGLSIVELLVGVAVGLVIVAAATMMVATQLSDNRRLLVETQVQQDLRATADLIARDLRRAGFWWNSQRVTALGSGPGGTMPNPYATVSPADDGDTAQEVTYRYAHPNQVEDDTVEDDERLGYRLKNGVIETQLGLGNWQALTDAGALKVTTFDVTVDKQDVPLACHRACSAGATPCPPVQSVRSYTIQIDGEAASDPAVKRSVRSHVRLRNDLVVGECRD
jgi:prepilin peptidase dependent protein B